MRRGEVGKSRSPASSRLLEFLEAAGVKLDEIDEVSC